MSRAYHLQNSAEHATPLALVEAGRQVLGAIDLDPATTLDINSRYVQAAKFFDAETDGLSQNWNGRVWLNPPGGCRVEVQVGKLQPDMYLRTRCNNVRAGKVPQCSCKLVKKFWAKLVAQHRAGVTTAAIWIGFSVEQLQNLQNAESELSPLNFPICYPRKRVAYCDPSNDMKAKTAPPHASYIAYLGPDRVKFVETFEPFGQCVLPAPHGAAREMLLEHAG